MYQNFNSTIKPPNLLDRLKSRILFNQCYLNNHLVPELDESQKNALNQLKHDGYATFNKYVDIKTLQCLQNEFQEALNKLSFDMPCLAQSKINPVQHSELIKNNLYGTPKQLEDWDVTFNANEANNYQQVISEFNPSTLTIPMLSYSETFRKIWTDPYLLGIVASYLGMVPKLAEAYVRRNFPAPYKTMNHFWHRDLNSPFHLLKIFIFLSDCTIDNGPHEYVRGSHNDYTLNDQRYFTDKQIDKIYQPGSNNRIKSIVSAGTIILEDTRGLHRANLPQTGIRDVGYCVFMPLRPFYQHQNYIFPQLAYNKLSPFQKAFIPKACIL